jgi:hypothetical protein
MPALIVSDLQRQKIETLRVRRAALGFIDEIGLDGFEGRVVVRFGA